MGRWDNTKEQIQRKASIKVALVFLGALTIMTVIGAAPSFMNTIQGGFSP